MSLSYHAEPNPNNPNQIRLFVSCTNDVQAEALWRALCRCFFRVSRRMPSFDPAFNAFFYVQTTKADLEHIWPQIVATVATATSASIGSSAPQSSPRATSQLNDLATWMQTFRAAVRQVHEEIPHQSTASQDVSLGWVVEQVRAGNTDAVESLLNQQIISPTSALRAQIALYSETGQYERLVALVESRRREVLALPTSGLLAEQIVGAYLKFGQASAVEEALRSVQQIAGAMLPELERLYQADGVRKLLHHTLTTNELSGEPISPTLHEQITGIIQVAPSDQVAMLETLRSEHPSAIELDLALGATYTAIGQLDAALEVYAKATPQNEAERIEVLRRRAELLIEAEKYREVINLLPHTDAIHPYLSALRGVALYGIGRTEESLVFMEQAWAAGERGRILLLPLARNRATASRHNDALHIYRILLDNAPDLLEPQDLAYLATGLYVDRPDDISSSQIADLCERYVAQGGVTTRPDTEVKDILDLRVRLWAEMGRMA